MDDKQEHQLFVEQNTDRKKKYIQVQSKYGITYDAIEGAEGLDESVPVRVANYIKGTQIDSLYVDFEQHTDKKLIKQTPEKMKEFENLVRKELLSKSKPTENSDTLIAKRYEEIKGRIANLDKIKSISNINPDKDVMFSSIEKKFLNKIKIHKYVMKIERVYRPMILIPYSKRVPMKMESIIKEANRSGLFYVRTSQLKDESGYVSYFTFLEPPDVELKQERENEMIKSKLMKGEDLGRNMNLDELTSTIEDVLRFILYLKKKQDLYVIYNCEFRVF